MATTAGLISRARLEIGDLPQPFQVRVVGDGLTNLVALQYKPVKAETLRIVLEDGAGGALDLIGGTDYTLDDTQGTISFTQPIDAGLTAVITGDSFKYFTDTEWGTFVNTAFLQHSHGREGVYLANLEPVEEYPLTLLAVTEALYVLLNDAAFDIDISTPEGVGIPRHQRYQQLTEMLIARLDQYNKLSAALNVGLFRIEMFDLRRVSKQTNKFIPIYRSQEIEDTRFPVRVFVPIDLKGGPASPDTVPDIPLAIVQGKPVTASINLDRDLTGAEVKVALRKYKASAAVKYFTVVVTDTLNGLVDATLSADLTYTLGGGPYWWDVRVFTNGIADSVLEGPVTIEERPRT